MIYKRKVGICLDMLVDDLAVIELIYGVAVCNYNKIFLALFKECGSALKPFKTVAIEHFALVAVGRQ